MKFDDYTTLPETNIAPQYGRVGSWKTSFLFLGDGFLTGANGVTFQRYTCRGYYLRDPKKGILIFQSSFFRVYFLNFKGCICLGIVYIHIIIYIYITYMVVEFPSMVIPWLFQGFLWNIPNYGCRRLKENQIRQRRQDSHKFHSKELCSLDQAKSEQWKKNSLFRVLSVAQLKLKVFLFELFGMNHTPNQTLSHKTSNSWSVRFQ